MRAPDTTTDRPPPGTDRDGPPPGTVDPTGLLSRRGLLRLGAVGAAGAVLGTAACGATTPGPEAMTSRGPITVWYSNNAQEVVWGEAVVASWNAAHPDQHVTAQEIPSAQSSEEVVGAAITAGTAPGVVLNMSPASVPQYVRQGGLVALSDFPDGDAYILARTGARAAQSRGTDGKYYQLPWKSNPVALFYNRSLLAKAGIDAKAPPLATYDQFLTASRRIVSSGVAQYAIWPPPTSEWYSSLTDFYPMYAAATGGTQLIRDRHTTYDSAAGRALAAFWRTAYAEKLASVEVTTLDTFAVGQAAMALVGPWAVASYKGKVDWGAVRVPTPHGTAADKVWTYSDAKNIAVFAACPHRATAWDFAKYATSPASDSALLQATGQFPLRTDVARTYAGYVAKNPSYGLFAEQADRTTDVPSVVNGIQVWQTFRDDWSRAVLFGRGSVDAALAQSARQIDGLVTA